MRVVCENCGATYKIPESKLVKEVNKATCRKCGFRMMIRRPVTAGAGSDAPPPPNMASPSDDVTPDEGSAGPTIHEAHTIIQEAVPAPTPAPSPAPMTAPITLPKKNEWSDEGPTQVRPDPVAAEADAMKAAARRKKASSDAAPTDMLLALTATFAAAAGPIMLATNTGGGDLQRSLGLFVGLLGALTCLFLLVTGNLWRRAGNVAVSLGLAVVLSAGGTAFVDFAMYEGATLSSGESTSKEPPARADGGAVDATNEKAQEADAGLDQKAAPSADAPPPSKEETKSVAPPPPAEREAPAPPEPSPAPVADEEDLGDPDFDDIPVADSRSSAEERRRQEMEDAAARARAEREERDSARSRRSEESRTARTAPPAPKAEPAGAPKMKSLPLTVVDTMIRSNMTVKRCFVEEKNTSGTLPKRINVKFTVMPTGKVSSARVTTAEYKGTTLDSCLGRAFKGISFPAFEGDPLSMTYPFIL